MLVASPHSAINRPFVGREPELAHLSGRLETMLGGIGQVCFVGGEPGAGKSALVYEFTRRAQEQHPELVTAVADCSSTSATSDAYLPFREILALLTGDVDASLAEGAITAENANRLRSLVGRASEFVAEYVVDLIDFFIPGTALVTRAGSKLAKRLGLGTVRSQAGRVAPAAGDPARIVQQFTNVIRNLATARPLILLIDDVHWADRASVDLLFHLSRRIEGSRIMVLATYRANEITAGRAGERHPLEAVLNEIRRYSGDVTINLDDEQPDARRAFVDRLLDAEPNALPRSFRDELLRHTQGHPLFTIELLEAMREQRFLARDSQGVWRLARPLVWDLMPARSEGIIAERLGRLPTDLQYLLSIAAVEGEQFTANVLARVAQLDVRSVVRDLSETAERQHRVVRAQSVQRIGEERVATYRFRHELFRSYLYERLDAVQRADLHFAVGCALESLHSHASATVAPALAGHFDRAGEPDRAIRYMDAAADLALRRQAPRQAAELWQRALELCASSTVSTGGVCAMMEKRGDALRLAGAFDDGRVALQQALSLATDPLSRARLLRKIGSCLADQHHLHDALTHLRQAQEMLPPESDRDDEVSNERVQLLLDYAWALYWVNDVAGIERLLADGDAHVERYGSAEQRARWLQTRVLAGLRALRYRPDAQLLDLAVRQLAAASAAGDGAIHGHAAFLHGFVNLWHGDLEAAERSLGAALRMAEKHAHGLIIVLANTYLGVLFRLRGAVEAAGSAAEATEVVAREAHMVTYVAAAQANQAWVHFKRGDFEKVEPLARAALDAWAKTPITYPFKWLAVWPLAAVLLQRGDRSQALAVMAATLESDQQIPPPEVADAVAAARSELEDVALPGCATIVSIVSA